jgi:hypothetical protein
MITVVRTVTGPPPEMWAAETSTDAAPVEGEHATWEKRSISGATGDAGRTGRDSLASSTDVPEIDAEALARHTLALFRGTSSEQFDTGSESSLGRHVQQLVRQHPGAGPDALKDAILAGNVPSEAAWEALRWLGCMEHAQSRAARLWLLESCLQSSSARVRDGAALGLATIDDPHAIPALGEAIAVEQIPELREDLRQVLAQLEATAKCPSC